MIKSILKKIVFKFLEFSLNASSKEQKLNQTRKKLEKIVPDLTNQYTSFKVEGVYLETKVRSQHAFQLDLVTKAISLLNRKKGETINLIDIGDSSGTHLIYLESLYKDIYKINALSVNLDPVAVTKIRNKGLDAIQASAELLHEHKDYHDMPDIFLSFEMIEHLIDPIGFLKKMATKSECEFFVVTVPYVKKSRVGLHQIRDLKSKMPFNAEVTHIFELSPPDWDLIFRFSGWKIIDSTRYTQYPKNILNPFHFVKYIWRKLDFEGFYGVILEKDGSISNKYQNW